MVKTVVQKLDSPDPDVTIFKVTGTLGFHENKVLAKFFEECSSRNIRKLIIDFSELGSLGGGCAKIIRDAAEGGTVDVVIAGASRTVQNFLQKENSAVSFCADVEQALGRLQGSLPTQKAKRPADRVAEKRETPAPGSAAAGANRAAQAGRKRQAAADVGDGYEDDVLSEVDDLLGVAQEAQAPERERVRAGSAGRADREARADAKSPEAACAVADPARDKLRAAAAEESKELKRRLVRYRALFSLNREFSRIEEKSKLLDAFMLTMIAQVGVESAAFLELQQENFIASCWKGFETADPKSLSIGRNEVDMKAWLQSAKIFRLGDAPISNEARQRIEKWDLPFAAPFIVGENIRGIVLLGKPIRQALDDDSWEFLKLMFDQVAIAYENSCRFERQSERTLGLVQSLISMIENNTVSRGTTELVMDLTYAVALRMHYAEEFVRDLLYGTVLRDIGMLNTAHLIVRSPRELLQEEWEVIKQHPVEGAQMLAKMGFSKHACDVVMHHHERYNGEGYPNGLAGPQIPLGARILSVVESYAAMLHDRPNRPALTRQEALNTLEENWGLRYDPEVVDVFIQAVQEEIRSGAPSKHRGIDIIKNRGIGR
jgi:HD-GYP domain-containing protein (c-di-GMP phosphodiesterase class II)